MLDIDETLVHSSVVPQKTLDTVITIGKDKVYVAFRPGAEEFIKAMGKIYEVVIFTAGLEKYAQPLMKTLDKSQICREILSREYCTEVDGIYAKDMSKLGRRLEDIILLDNSPDSYSLQKNNGMPILSWYNDTSD